MYWVRGVLFLAQYFIEKNKYSYVYCIIYDTKVILMKYMIL